jgi:hypothetical protein
MLKEIAAYCHFYQPKKIVEKHGMIIAETKNKLFSKKSTLLATPNMSNIDTFSAVISKALEFINTAGV